MGEKITKYFLVTETKLFIDPHGSSDTGEITKFVTTDESYATMNGKTYQYDEEVEDDDLQGSEDGYNAEAEEYRVREITKEEYDEYSALIKAYNKLK